VNTFILTEDFENPRNGLPFTAEVDGTWCNRGWWYDRQPVPGHAAYLVGQALYYIPKIPPCPQNRIMVKYSQSLLRIQQERMRIMKLRAIVLIMALVVCGQASLAEVSYLGPEGTYTQEAAQFWFEGGEILVPCKTVNDAISDMLSGQADYAVIPQENTLGGAVLNYVDALIASEDAYVVGEVILPINQTLMGVPGAKLEDIRTVCSHAQGLAQSAQWLKDHLPEAGAQEMDSTAAAASYVAEQGDRSIAAVAAPGAAPLYGLEVLAENVQITDANKTRFYVLSSQPLEGERQTRAVFVATCECGSLDDIMLAIHDAGLEPVALHDRPEGSALGRYHYVIEVEGADPIGDEQIDRVRAIEGVRFAGRFESAEKAVNQAERIR